MKRVGIITLYYKNYNYGGQLGAYALQKAIAMLGFQCEQIAFKWLNEYTLQAYESAKSAEYFRTFSESIPHSERLYTVSDIAECVDDYDIFVCGSDQIWGLPWVISLYKHMKVLKVLNILGLFLKVFPIVNAYIQYLILQNVLMITIFLFAVATKSGVCLGLFPMTFYPVWHFLLFQHQKRKLHTQQAWEVQK
ncbi:hypothetical protein QW71_05265 [Paenibacillus sp. IHB B 3415]|nr:hypothetical protein QW71_05265 [Paenibacillus sp. IHB B 3415]